MRTMTMITIALAAAGLAGCTSTAATEPTSTRPPATGAAAARPATTAPSPAAPVRPSTAPAARPAAGSAEAARCTGSQLRFTAAGSEGAAGTAYHAIRVTNIGPAGCRLRGYVRLHVVDAAGHQVPTIVRRGAIGALSSEPPRLTLATGGWGWFLVASHPAASDGCQDGLRTGTRLAITAPGTSQVHAISWGSHATCDELGLSAIEPASMWEEMPSR